MLRKLSLRFTAVGVAALFCVELLMIALINGLNYHYTVSEADEVTQTILDNRGKMPDHFRPDRPKNDDSAPDRRGSEMRYVTRFFTVLFNADGRVDRIDTGNISSVTGEQAQSCAYDVIAMDEEKGFYEDMDFRYAIKKTPDGGKMVVFYDFSEKAQTMVRMFEISCAIAEFLLLFFSMLILLFSKRAVRPVMESVENQRRFITDAGHELKTPLAIIRADTEVIEMTDGETEWTRSILNQTDRLSELLGQMLTLTKTQEIMQNSFKQFDLSEAFRETAEGFSPLFSSQGNPFDISVESGISVNGDRQSLCTLLSVLLQNAAKYSSKGEPVTMRLSSAGGKAALCVENFCDEPPQGDTRLLFERFYRADSSRTRETGGSGIGLSVARSVADAHKAKIFCTVDGKKVTFTVKIPI